MRFYQLSLLFTVIIISSCGGGSSSTEIEIDSEVDSSDEPCINYQTSLGVKGILSTVGLFMIML